MTTATLDIEKKVQPYQGDVLDQKQRLEDEVNSYWLPLKILVDGFDQPYKKNYNLSDLKEIEFEFYDIRTGETANCITLSMLCLLNFSCPTNKENYTLLQYLKDVPRIGTILPHFYSEYLASFTMLDDFVRRRIHDFWQEGNDLSYLTVRLNEEGRILFTRFKDLQSLHESFLTKTPPTVKIQILANRSHVNKWKRFLLPMGLDIYAVRSEASRHYSTNYYITNVHRLDDLIATVPAETLKGVINLTNNLIGSIKSSGLKPYRLPGQVEGSNYLEPAWSDMSSLQPSKVKKSLIRFLTTGDSDTKFIVGLFTLCLFAPFLAYLLGK